MPIEKAFCDSGHSKRPGRLPIRPLREHLVDKLHTTYARANPFKKTVRSFHAENLIDIIGNQGSPTVPIPWELSSRSEETDRLGNLGDIYGSAGKQLFYVAGDLLSVTCEN